MIDRALALNLTAIAKREAANGNDHIAEVLRLTADAVKAGTTRIEQLEAALSKPITMQDIRLCAGEGKLSANTVLVAANIVLRQRASQYQQQVSPEIDTGPPVGNEFPNGYENQQEASDNA